ncbi:hybrid sensor histidine kinase/response regulator [Achromobacter spanius]|uniref:Virulence sensor protein BvgS n=1 Tax=Achromobacter spanius TaxID=217203 RepID=A0A2S0IGB8_9BURK|nr:hybrid sensor histidine kinase/response regulator [Achromobacter spanius]
MLLHLFAAAMLACIAAAAAFLLYWSFTSTVSTYRRQMNAAAYNAQIFFDQRESLLRSLASSLVRNTDAAPASETPRHFGNTGQINVFPLHEEPNAYDWALILTPRDLNEIAFAQTQLLFSSTRNGQTTYVAPRSGQRTGLDDAAQSWIARELAMADPNAAHGGQNAITWLKPPLHNANPLYLYTPVESSTPRAGWIGLELGDINAAIDLSSLRGGSYILHDQDGAPVLHSPDDPQILAGLSQHAGREDAFGWWGPGLLPRYVVLSKSVGEDGWRLVYYTPVSRILSDASYAIQATLGGALLLCAAVIFGIRHIRKKLVAPALRQYEALAESVSLNRRLVEVAPVGLCLLRRSDGMPLLSNELARDWLLEDPALLARLLTEDSHGTEREYVLDDGRCLYLTFAPITYRAENVLLCGINDITAFKRVEHSITQAKLHADAANHAKTVFLTTMSHEIRTPLFGILGTLELLGLTAMDSQQQQYLQTMQQSSATLLSSINDTLDLSRIEAGYLKLETSEFSPVLLLDSVIGTYAARADAKGLHLHALADVATPARVLGDATRVRQILNNLVNNAIKYTGSGQVVLRLQTLSQDAHFATLKFQVADTGMGISAKHHARLFEPYYRAETGSNQNVHGTGLGLAICRRLSEMMSGTLSAVSEPGLGTSMSLVLTLPQVGGAHEDLGVRLDPRPVFVRGANNEVVANLCQWLRHCGALAMPYKAAVHGRREGGVLVETWSRDLAPAVWSGARVFAQPPGVQPRPTRNTWTADSHSLASIVAAVRLAQDSVATKAPAALEPSRDALDMHLLVVEDNPVSRQILREQLEHLGCTVVLASDGNDALALPELLDFDAILTDLHMPELDGYALARALRRQGYTRPIVGITASAFTEDLQRSKEAGMNTVLLKPLPIAALCQALTPFKEAA